MVGEMMRECLDDFVNLRTTREEFDEMVKFRGIQNLFLHQKRGRKSDLTTKRKLRSS